MTGAVPRFALISCASCVLLTARAKLTQFSNWARGHVMQGTSFKIVSFSRLREGSICFTPLSVDRLQSKHRLRYDPNESGAFAKTDWTIRQPSGVSPIANEVEQSGR